MICFPYLQNSHQNYLEIENYSQGQKNVIFNCEVNCPFKRGNVRLISLSSAQGEYGHLQILSLPLLILLLLSLCSFSLPSSFCCHPPFWQAPCFCSIIPPFRSAQPHSASRGFLCCLFWRALPTEHEYEKLLSHPTLLSYPSSSFNAASVSLHASTEPFGAPSCLLRSLRTVRPLLCDSECQSNLGSTRSGWATRCEWVALCCMCHWNCKCHARFDIDISAWRQAGVFFFFFLCFAPRADITLPSSHHSLLKPAAVVLCCHRFDEIKGKTTDFLFFVWK